MMIDDRLRSVFSSVFELDAASLVPEDSPRSIAGWDSVNHIHLILAIESEYQVTFDPSEIADLTSVGLIARRLESLGAND